MFVLVARIIILIFTSMKNNSIRKQNSYGSVNPEVYPFVISDLEQTIQPHNYLGGKLNCGCDLCIQKRMQGKQPLDGNLFRTNSKESAYWLKKILDGLCLSGAKTLKLNLPDILFLEGDSLQIFQTNRKDGRLIKLSNTVPLKSMYPTIVRFRKQYKSMLQQNFNEKMLDNIDPQFMHIKYFDKFVPSFFHDGMSNMQSLQDNKYQFKRYILHKNKKYQIHQIEEHKMNQKDPCCLVKYKDGNCQLFNQREFEVYSLSLQSKLQEELVFVQSYIKYKLETVAIYYSQYTLGPATIDHEIDNRAQRQTIILIGGMSKFDAGYKDVQTFEQLCFEMMMEQPREYVKLMTYKIVHYLSMTSRIYIDHIKIKWIMNDIGNIYMQEIMEFEMSEIPRRLIKYRLPPKDQSLDMYHQSNKFVQMYVELKRRKNINTQLIRKSMEKKSYEEILKFMDPELKMDIFIEEKPSLYTTLVNNGSEDSQNCLRNSIEVKTVNKKQRGNESKTQRYQNVSSYERHLKEKSLISESKKNRYNSLNLQKWRNIGLSIKREKVSRKINSSFTIKVQDEASTNHRSIDSNNSLKPSLRKRVGQHFCKIDQEKTRTSFYNTIQIGKSVGKDRSVIKARNKGNNQSNISINFI